MKRHLITVSLLAIAPFFNSTTRSSTQDSFVKVEILRLECIDPQEGTDKMMVRIPPRESPSASGKTIWKTHMSRGQTKYSGYTYLLPRDLGQETFYLWEDDRGPLAGGKDDLFGIHKVNLNQPGTYPLIFKGISDKKRYHYVLTVRIGG